MANSATFTLPQEIIDRLKKEKNKSALVSALLLKYFELDKTSDAQQQLNSLREEEKRKLEIERKAEDKKQALRDSFKLDLGREITEEELETYLDLFEAGLTHYFKYMESLKNGA